MLSTRSSFCRLVPGVVAVRNCCQHAQPSGADGDTCTKQTLKLAKLPRKVVGSFDMCQMAKAILMVNVV